MQTKMAIARYGLLGLPLAMVALPLYLLLPHFYGQTLGVNLILLGVLLFALRLIDAACDPLLGKWIDRVGHWQRWIIAASVLLAVGMWLLFSPEPGIDARRALFYLVPGLVLVYAGFSVATISYFAMGTALADTPTSRTGLSAMREAAGLMGVLLASTLPYVLPSYGQYVWVFVVILITALLLMPPTAQQKTAAEFSWWHLLRQPSLFKSLLGVQALCGVSASICATLMLFFISEVLYQPSWTPVFLGAYFLSAALSTVLWSRFSARWGKARSWLSGIVLSILIFISVLFLKRGDAIPFLIICILTGLMLGADLVLPPAWVADVIDDQQHLAGQYFGVWTALNKICLAAGSLALPLWQWLDQQMGFSTTVALVSVYVGVPIILRLWAAIQLYFIQREYLT